jgi:hypothetical protein
MCRIIYDTTLSNSHKAVLGSFLMNVDTLIFRTLAHVSHGEQTLDFDEWFDSKASEAKWKQQWMIHFHDDSDRHYQKRLLTETGVL